MSLSKPTSALSASKSRAASILVGILALSRIVGVSSSQSLTFKLSSPTIILILSGNLHILLSSLFCNNPYSSSLFCHTIHTYNQAIFSDKYLCEDYVRKNIKGIKVFFSVNGIYFSFHILQLPSKGWRICRVSQMIHVYGLAILLC